MCKVASHAEDPAATTTPPTSPPADQSFIPANPICLKAYSHACTYLAPAILNHSIRVFLYARHIATLPLPPSFKGFSWSRRSAENQETLIFIAALFHDMGTSDAFDGDERFEVCGANAAVDFMTREEQAAGKGMGASARDDVWTAVACHTSAGIAENITPLARIVRLAVLCDFDRVGIREELMVLGMVGEMEGRFERRDVERVLGKAVLGQIRRRKGGGRDRKAPGNSWPGGLWRGAVEMREKGLEGVNIYF
jgi:hypothetical protein